MQYFTNEDISVEIFVDGEEYFYNLYNSLIAAKRYMYLYFWQFACVHLIEPFFFL